MKNFLLLLVCIISIYSFNLKVSAEKRKHQATSSVVWVSNMQPSQEICKNSQGITCSYGSKCYGGPRTCESNPCPPCPED
jgi:hypothetical protein